MHTRDDIMAGRGARRRTTMAEESAEYAKGMLGLLRGLLAVHRQVVNETGRPIFRRKRGSKKNASSIKKRHFTTL
ncbi:uncharacterized protein LOC100577772 isoform X1 [Apis mellifera]|uniref:Uncharacterized protein LOC100577772 isoform X1 n=1 Tax=Apis mellifera TaxID=7460 RepID=A0A7M7SQH8_APIME|nr:uncharacterized protein LOC100577772 isoform X1 [Apis mellifera]|eukprot:XP_026299051.1 uncharacterized protein LOC100577772 isoform X1 [Apis mellifera]